MNICMQLLHISMSTIDTEIKLIICVQGHYDHSLTKMYNCDHLFRRIMHPIVIKKNQVN